MIDIAKFEHIVDENSRPIYKYCYLRLDGDDCLAEETVGDVFRILFESWDSPDTQKNVRECLYRIADDCIKRARREMERRERFSSLSESYGETAANIKEKDQPLWYDEYFADEKAEADHINRIRESLPEDHRELFDLRHIRRMTISEISQETGIPYSSLRPKLQKLERLVRAEIRRIFG